MNTAMDFVLFRETIVRRLQEKKGENVRVFSDRVKKNNGVILTGIMMEEKGCDTSPAIYIDEFYESYRKGTDFEDILLEIDKLFSENKIPDNLDLSDFESYDKARTQIAFKLINYEKNWELLKKVPHKIFHNLAVVYYYIINKPPFYGEASIVIQNEHLKDWGICADELHENALRYTPKLFPVEIECMDGTVQGAAENSQISENEETEKRIMYILSNKQKLQGAATMLYPRVMKTLAEKLQCDLYILPSSIHEVILMEKKPDIVPEALLFMVKQINATQVEESEVLADSVYLYSREKDKIERIA